MSIRNVVRCAVIGVLAFGLSAALQACQPKTQEPAKPHTTSPSADSAVAAATSLDRGRMAYLGYCGMCHGAYGAGDGPMAADLVKQGARGPAVLNNKPRLDQLGRDGLINVISRGGAHTGRSNLMPPWGERLDEQLIANIADFILTLPDLKPGPTTEVIQQFLQAPPGSPVEGRRLFVFYCTACHGPQGKGDGPSADTLWARNKIRPRDLTDSTYFKTKKDQEIYATVSLGGGHMGKSVYMPAWTASLTTEQLKDLLSYVRTISHTASVK
jgi:mono/diheme cytochrome c family protein